MTQDLKAALLEHGRNFEQCRRHDVLLEYLQFALEVVDGMPSWDLDAHNKLKQQTANQLEGLFLKAVKAAAPPPEQREALARLLGDLELQLPKAHAVLGVGARS